MALLLLTGAAQAGPIHDAAAADDVPTIMSLIKAGTSPDELNEAGETALIIATRLKHGTAVNVLLRLLADPNIAMADGRTAMHVAALNDDAYLLYVLADGRGDPNARDKDGATPMILAAKAGYGLALVKLEQWGGDFEIADNAGRTPLTHAGRNGHDMVVNILLRKGAVCQTIDADWHAACEARRAELGLD
jgi:ankyrin repeat protein